MLKEKLLKNAVLTLLAVVFFIVTVLFTTKTQNIVLNKPVAVVVVGMAILFLWIIHSVERGSFELPSSPVTFPLVMMILIGCVIHTAISPFKYYALEESGRFLGYFIAILAIIKYMTDMKTVMKFLNFIVLITCFTSVYGIMQIYGIDPFVEWGMPTIPYVSTFGNQNFFAGYLVTVIPICIAIIFTSGNYTFKSVSFLTYVLASFNIIYSGNRSAIIGWAFENMLFIIFSIRFGFLSFCLKNKKVFFITIISSLILFILTFYVSMKLSPYFDLRMKTIFQTKFGTNKVRVIMWTGAARMFREKPIMGQGMGTFQLTFGPKRPSNYNRSGVSHNTMHSHNEYMEWFSEMGLVGITLFWWIMASYFIFTIHMLIKVKNKIFRNLQIGLMCSVLGFLVENIMSVNYRWTAPALNAWFVMGLSVALCYAVKNEVPALQPSSSKKTQWNTNPVKYILYAGLVIMFVYMLSFCFKMIKSDFYLKMGMVRVDSGTPNEQMLNEAEYFLKKSIELYPFDLSSYYKLGFVYLQKGSNLINKNQMQEGRTFLLKALDMYNEIIKLAPNYAQIHNNLGMLHNQLRNEFEAVRQFEWATILENNEKNHENLIRFYINRFNNPGNAFYHAYMLKEIAREEKDRKIGMYLYNYPHISKIYSIEKINEDTKRFYSEFSQYQDLYTETLRNISSIRSMRNDNKSAVNWISLAIDLNDSNTIYKAVMMEYMMKSNNIGNIKKYFYFLDKKYSDIKFKGELFKNILPLFNQYAQNGTNKPDDRAEVYLLMAKA
ncbi:O-antigen ligase family protein, partial [Candidatus Dependentiae bacterium]|nr:O-antigen ligase family protein [Candidatus Dependentiae bacterium]